MMNTIRIGALAMLATVTLCAGSPAQADTVFQTAVAVSDGSGDYPVYGDGTNQNSNFVGVSFAVAEATTTLEVGANIDAFGKISGGSSGDGGNGLVFAEVVSLSSLSSVPSVPGSSGNSIVAWLQANDLGHALLNVPSIAGDASTIIHFGSALSAGNSYAVIFGSGLYGATGGINLTSGNATIGEPNLFNTVGGDTFSPYGYDTGIRIYATSPVPLPAALPLLVSGISLVLGRSRRGRRDAPVI